MYFDNFGSLNNTPKPSAKGPWPKTEMAVTRTSPSLPFLHSLTKQRNTGWAITLKDRILGLAATKRKTYKTKNSFSKDEASRRLYDDDHDDDACSRHAHTNHHIHNLL